MIPSTIANIPFLCAAPDWSAAPGWKRSWIGDIAAAIRGGEQRAAMRSRGLVTLGYRLAPADAEERAQVEAVLRAALKAGRVAIPYWTHGADLLDAAATAASLLTLDSSLFTFSSGDWLWMLDDSGAQQLNRVLSVAGSTLHLAERTRFALDAGALVWPVVFGVPKAGGDHAVDSPARLLLGMTVSDIDESYHAGLNPLAAPSVVSPAAGGSMAHEGARIVWSEIAGAIGYLVEIFEGAVCGGTPIFSGMAFLSNPSVAEPAAAGVVPSEGGRVRWTTVAGAGGYRIEIFDGGVCGGTPVYQREVSA
ncbi:MAG: hypothetical protein NTY01_06895 [Verrucomicrobia bacterium]|nr:hypothetical protein [Verrucomicrobiota bacterium]